MFLVVEDPPSDVLERYIIQSEDIVQDEQLAHILTCRKRISKAQIERLVEVQSCPFI